LAKLQLVKPCVFFLAHSVCTEVKAKYGRLISWTEYCSYIRLMKCQSVLGTLW